MRPEVSHPGEGNPYPQGDELHEDSEQDKNHDDLAGLHYISSAHSSKSKPPTTGRRGMLEFPFPGSRAAGREMQEVTQVVWFSFTLSTIARRMRPATGPSRRSRRRSIRHEDSTRPSRRF